MKDAETLLRLWGRWSRDNPGLLISSVSVIGRCMQEGAGASHVRAKDVITMPTLVELTEAIVLEMSDDLRDAIVLKFVRKMYARDACKLVHCGTSEYYNRVNLGVMFTTGWLHAIEKS